MNEIVFAAVTPEHERPLQELLLRNADDANWEPEEAEARAGAVAARATAPDAVAMVALDEAAAVGVAMLVPGDHASVRHVAALVFSSTARTGTAASARGCSSQRSSARRRTG